MLPHRFAVAQFLPDRHSVLIAQFDGDLYRWDTRVDHAIDFACAMAGRDLTRTEWADSLGDRRYRATCPEG